MLYLFEDFILDTDRHELRKGEAVLAVEPQVFDLLVFLVQHRERVVTQDDLLNGVWQGRIVSESTLRSRINAVRAAVGDNGEEQRLIRTVPRKGTRFVGEVTEQDSRLLQPQLGANGSSEVQPREQGGDATPVQEALPQVAEPPEAITAATPERHSEPIEPDTRTDVAPARASATASVPGSAAASAAMEAETGASAAATKSITDTPLAAQASSRRQAVVLIAACGLIGAIAIAAAAFLLGRSGTNTGPSLSGTAPAEKFDASVVPLLTEDNRRVLAKYPASPDFKAVAIGPARFGVAEGEPDAEAARRDALRRCNARSQYECRLYAVGEEVVWSKASLPVPSPEDLRTELTEHRLAPADVPLIRDASRKSLERYLNATDHRAVALTAGRAWAVTQRSSPAEAARLAVEWCSEVMRKPCLLLSVNGFLTIPIPKSRNVVGIFLPSTQAGISVADRARIVQAYRDPEWRALARGSKGAWHPVAGAPSEAAAVDAAMAACAKVDEGCRIFAIGNFLVSPQQ